MRISETNSIRLWQLDRYKLASGGVNVARTSQLMPDKEAKLNDPNSAVTLSISEEAKRLNKENK